MWFGRTVTTAGTPVPKREVEEKSRGSGSVITYRLSPEKLERVRRGERLEDVRKEDQPMTTVTEAPKAPDKLEVLRRLAAGWKIARIEEELGLSKGALQYWLGKWGLKGVRGEQAQRLLDETLIDQKAEYTAEQPAEKAPAPKPETTAAEVVQGMKEYETVERLRRELAAKEAKISELEAERERNRDEIEKLKAANARAVALAGQTAEKHLADIEKLKEERDALLQTIERAVGEGGRREVECVDAIEAATAGLVGGLAYHTGAAIQHLWQWKTVEDLRRARGNIDRLIESAVMEGAG